MLKRLLSQISVAKSHTFSGPEAPQIAKVSEEDPSQVTAIIDWQSTSIGPVFSYANEEPDS
jgi:hypothetical protein